MERDENRTDTTTEEMPRIEAISQTEANASGDDCQGCAGKPYC